MPWQLLVDTRLLCILLIFSKLAAAITYADETENELPTLLPKEIAQLRPFTHYASAAYCHPDEIIDWSCEGSLAP